MAIKFLTTIQAAAVLRVHRSRVWQLIKAGKLPAAQFGRDWLVKKNDLDKFQKLDRPKGRPKGVKK